MPYYVTERTPCLTCEGRGHTGPIRVADNPGPWGETRWRMRTITCAMCKGTGKIVREVLLEDALATLGLIAGAMDK